MTTYPAKVIAAFLIFAGFIALLAVVDLWCMATGKPRPTERDDD